MLPKFFHVARKIIREQQYALVNPPSIALRKLIQIFPRLGLELNLELGHPLAS